MTVIERLMHVSTAGNMALRQEHARFIVVRLCLACVACALMPVYALLMNEPSAVVLTVFVGVASLLVPAVVVSVTGQLRLGYDLSSILCSGFIVALSMLSGGVNSPAVALLAIVLLDTAFQASKEALGRTAVICVVAYAVILVTPHGGGGATLSPLFVPCALFVYALALSWALLDRNERAATSGRQQHARATAALDAVGDVVLWRERDGTISFGNAATVDHLGLDRRELSEQTLLDRINVGDRPAFLKAISDAATGTLEGSALVRMQVTREGDIREYRTFEASMRPVADTMGAVVLVMRDVTQRQADDELREAARRDAERIASSKSSFIATMSHELRTPLNAIIGFSDLLMQVDVIPHDDPRREEYARIINGSGQHLLEIVNAILDMSKIESGMMTVEQERVDAARILTQSRDLLSVKAQEKDVALSLEASPDLPEIVSDRRALKQIVINLMSNAVKFTPEGGQVSITAVRDREHIEIVVSDTGCGICEEDLKSLGSPFFQARQNYDRQHEGTGLGLSVVRGLVGLMGGDMMLESALGEGTRVAIRLPIAGAQPGRTAEPVQISTRIRARRSALEARILDAPPGHPAPLRMTA